MADGRPPGALIPSGSRRSSADGRHPGRDASRGAHGPRSPGAVRPHPRRPGAWPGRAALSRGRGRHLHLGQQAHRPGPRAPTDARLGPVGPSGHRRRRGRGHRGRDGRRRGDALPAGRAPRSPACRRPRADPAPRAVPRRCPRSGQGRRRLHAPGAPRRVRPHRPRGPRGGLPPAVARVAPARGPCRHRGAHLLRHLVARSPPAHQPAGPGAPRQATSGLRPGGVVVILGAGPMGAHARRRGHRGATAGHRRHDPPRGAPALGARDVRTSRGRRRASAWRP